MYILAFLIQFLTEVNIFEPVYRHGTLSNMSILAEINTIMTEESCNNIEKDRRGRKEPNTEMTVLDFTSPKK